MSDCTVLGCVGVARSLGFCSKHLQRQQRHGDPEIVKKQGRKRQYAPVCSIEGCGGVTRKFGFCNKHVLRLKQTGTTEPSALSHASLLDRFWRQVDRRSDDKCWLWLGSTKGKGYGRIGAGGKGGKYLGAHRLSCEIAHGPPPFERAMALHSCDNPSCVNPAHLRWGTGSENIKEAFDKSRKHPAIKLGESHPHAVLNVEQVKFIRANREMGAAKLSRLMGGKLGAVRSVLIGRTWKHIKD